jgi:N-formylglutamate amidohydrolase
MKKLILHIPHSSIQIPSFDGYIISDALINKEVLKLTDWHTEELFSNTFDDSIVAPVSRIFCDMERFADDEKEIMSKKGM